MGMQLFKLNRGDNPDVDHLNSNFERLRRAMEKVADKLRIDLREEHESAADEAAAKAADEAAANPPPTPVSGQPVALNEDAIVAKLFQRLKEAGAVPAEAAPADEQPERSRYR